MKRSILLLGIALALTSAGCGGATNGERTLTERLYLASTAAVEKSKDTNEAKTCEQIEVPKPPVANEPPEFEVIEACSPEPEDVVCHQGFITCIDGLDAEAASKVGPENACIEGFHKCLEALYAKNAPDPQSCDELATQILKDTADTQLADVTREMCEFDRLAQKCAGVLNAELKCEPLPEPPAPPVAD